MVCTQSETVQSRPWAGTVVVLYVTLQDRAEGQSAQTVDTQAGGKGFLLWASGRITDLTKHLASTGQTWSCHWLRCDEFRLNRFVGSMRVDTCRVWTAT